MSDRAEQTRDRILDAAEKLFLDKGFDGASMSALARAAKVNQSLISHHFGNKRGLYDATFGRLNQRYFRLQAQRLAQGEGAGIELFEASVRAWLEFLAAEPDAVRLQAWTWLSGHNEPHPMAKEVILAGFERLRDGQEKGILRDDLPPELIWAAFIGLGYGWALVRDGHVDLLNQQRPDEAFTEAASSILLDGVRGPKA
jgi:AcrR family transcriptional regulator